MEQQHANIGDKLKQSSKFYLIETVNELEPRDFIHPRKHTNICL